VNRLQDGLQIHPTDAKLHDNLGAALFQNGRLDDAIAHFQKALELRPDFRTAADDLARAAWILATSPDASVRNGARALQLARQVNQVTRGKDPAHLAILAAAFAATGQFSDAVATAQQALELAAALNDQPMVESLRGKIELYRSGTPLRIGGPRTKP